MHIPLYFDRFIHNHGFEFVLLRLGCILFSNTWFAPDEVFQSVEVAYHMVYGQGYLSWEWSSKWALRSTLHPLIYAVPFYLSRLLNADYGWLIRLTPQIIHAFLFSAADYSYVQWLKRQGLPYNVFNLTLLLYFTNWFILYCSTRTLSNTLECCISLIALNWYESNRHANDKQNHDGFGIAAFLATLTTILRPTAVLLWAPLFLSYLIEHSRTKTNSFDFYKGMCNLLGLIPYALIVLILAFTLDSIYYGRPVFSIYNFLLFNVFSGGNALFGANPWHWYFTQGLPSVLGLAFIPMLTLPFNFHYSHIPRRYGIAACVYIIGHTFISHKEHRFVLPIIPFILPYIASELHSYRFIKIRNLLKYLILISNLLLIVYTGLIHQRGPYAANSKVLKYLEGNSHRNIYILQLMPCFSMPMYAGIHPYGNGTQIMMLDCGINQENIGKSGEVDEADEFHSNPEEWLNKYWFSKKLYLNDLIISYEIVYNKTELFLMGKGYERFAVIFHTIITSSSRQSTKIIMIKKRN